jgi:hypothetical protein
MQELCDDLYESFHKLLTRTISNWKPISYEVDINNNIYINQTFIKYIDEIILPDVKWKFITDLQNNGLQNTYVEMYILNLQINVMKIIHYQMLDNVYINTFVL